LTALDVHLSPAELDSKTVRTIEARAAGAFAAAALIGASKGSADPDLAAGVLSSTNEFTDYLVRLGFIPAGPAQSGIRPGDLVSITPEGEVLLARASSKELATGGVTESPVVFPT